MSLFENLCVGTYHIANVQQLRLNNDISERQEFESNEAFLVDILEHMHNLDLTFWEKGNLTLRRSVQDYK
jgi:hypothetical protein